jgi:methionyl-tRNA formyltransferase
LWSSEVCCGLNNSPTQQLSNSTTLQLSTSPTLPHRPSAYNPPVRIVFFGTPAFAVPSLEAVAAAHEVALVVAQPDRPAGRGMKMHSPEVAVRARELGLPLVQPAKIRNDEFLETIRAARPDAGVVIAYGRILPAALLAIPPHGFFNVHGSILPAWRGAAPIQRAIEAGDAVTGVTIMRIDEELDHGPMLATASTAIGPDERTPQLAARLARIGADALLPVLDDIARGTAVETGQDHARATIAPKIERSEGEVTFAERAARIYDRFRAFDPWPGLFFRSGDEVVKLTDLRPADAGAEPGSIVELGDAGVVVACGEGALRLLELQRPGKPRMPAAVVARALGWEKGMRIAP